LIIWKGNAIHKGFQKDLKSRKRESLVWIGCPPWRYRNGKMINFKQFFSVCTFQLLILLRAFMFQSGKFQTFTPSIPLVGCGVTNLESQWLKLCNSKQECGCTYCSNNRHFQFQSGKFQTFTPSIPLGFGVTNLESQWLKLCNSKQECGCTYCSNNRHFQYVKDTRIVISFIIDLFAASSPAMSRWKKKCGKNIT